MSSDARHSAGGGESQLLLFGLISGGLLFASKGQESNFGLEIKHECPKYH